MQGLQTTKTPAIDSPVSSPSPMASPVQMGGECGFGIADCGLKKSAIRISQSAIRRAFTLTELLVVIAIIGVLASLITAAAVNAFKNAKRSRIVLEIKNMSGALENFKTDYGAYPPNAMNLGTTSAPLAERISSDFERMAKKVAPRINSTELEVFRAIAGDPNVNTTIIPSDFVPNGISASEAVYFWFGGFSADPQFPLSGPGGPSFDRDDVEVLENRNRRYEFDLGLLSPRDDDGRFLDIDNDGTGRYVTYNVDLNGDGDTMDVGELRRINFWRVAPSGSEQTYVYFDCSRYKPYQYNMRAFDTTIFTDAPEVYALIQLRSGAGANPTVQDLVYVNQKKFQILHPGLDDSWGNEFADTGTFPNVPPTADPDDYILFPTGPFTGEIADTLSNFTDGELADSQE